MNKGATDMHNTYDPTRSALTKDIMSDILRHSTSAQAKLSMQCATCCDGNKYSANPWDYFLQPDDFIIRCPRCSNPYVLTETRHAYINQQPFDIGGYFATIQFETCIAVEATRGAMFRWQERHEKELRQAGTSR